MYNHQMPIIRIDGMMRNLSIRECIQNKVIADDIDVNESMSEIDVIIGKVSLDANMYGSHLCGTEAILDKVKHSLLEKGACSIDLRDMNSILKYLSGSNGYINCREAIKDFQDWELGFISSWLCIYSKLQYEQIDSLNIGILVENKEMLDMKVGEIFDIYMLNHKSLSHQINSNITVIPSYYWISEQIKKLKEEQ